MPEKKAPEKTVRAVKNKPFIYEGMDKKNQKISGEIFSPSLERARSTLREQGINVFSIKKKGQTIFGLSGSRTKKVKREEITIFTRQMATMLNAGIPLVQGMQIISGGSPGSGLSELARKITVDIETGNAFSVSLRNRPEYFDELYCSLIESGEQSGTLDLMLNRIALYKEKSDSLRRKIKKALYYPAAVVGVALIVTLILLIKVVPTFQDLFKAYKADLPGFTQFVLDISNAVQNHGIIILCTTVIGVFFFIQLYKKYPPFKHIVQRLILKLPVVGYIVKNVIVARFARTLATTTAAGVPLTESLDSVAKASDNIVFYKAIQRIREGVSAGQHMTAMIKKTEVFPLMLVQLVGIGEESGELDSMLAKIATIYEEEVDTAVDGLTSLLEPIIMVLLGVIVGGLVIAMYLPIFKMGSLF